LNDGVRRWASVEFTEDPSLRAEQSLVTALAVRSTDRRLFKRGVLSGQLLQEMKSDERAFTRASLHMAHAPFNDEFKKFVLQSEARLVDDEQAVRDVLNWVRFTQADIESSRDGMPAEGLGLKRLDLVTFRLLKNHPRILPWLKKLGMSSQMRASLGKQVDSSASLICVSVRSKDRHDLIEAGQLMFRAWLRLNGASFGVQPMTLSSLGLYASLTGIEASAFPARWKSHFKSGETAFRKAFGMTANEIPAWMLRTGLSEPLPKPAQTLRLPLERVLEN